MKVSVFKMTFKEIKDNLGNIIRSFGIGLWIGFLPGLGANISNVVAYATQRKFSKHPETFGKGNIEGVWAPEVSNNASIGGSLIPTITLGIPGSAMTAILMMGMAFGGVSPGPLLMQSNPTLVYMIYASTLLGGLGVMIFQILAMPIFPLMLRAPYHILYPLIMVLCFIGTYATVGNNSSTIVLILFTLLGIWFHYADIPATPFIIALILGNILEKNFRNAIAHAPDLGWKSFFVRPVSCLLLMLTVFLLFWPIIKKIILSRNAKFKEIINQVQEDD